MKLAITTALLLFATLPGQAVELKLKWQPGKRYVFVQETTSTATVPMGDLKMETNSRMTQTMYNDVTAHEKGSSVQTSFKSIVMKTMMNGAVAMEFDSSDPAKSGGLIGDALAPIAKAKFDTIYDKDGKVVEIKGLDEIQDAAQMGLGKGELEAMAKQSAALLPGKDVQPGDTWETKVDVPLGALGKDAVLKYTCKLESVGDKDGKKVATISMTGEMKMDLNDGGEQLLTVEAKKITGTMIFDLALGQPVETKTSMKLEMGVPGGLPGGAPGQGAPGKMPVEAVSVQTLASVEDLKK